MIFNKMKLIWQINIFKIQKTIFSKFNNSNNNYWII